MDEWVDGGRRVPRILGQTCGKCQLKDVIVFVKVCFRHSSSVDISTEALPCCGLIQSPLGLELCSIGLTGVCGGIGGAGVEFLFWV